MHCLVSDRNRIANEFAILCDNYVDDYPQLQQMFDIANDLCGCSNPRALEKAYKVLVSKLLLIARYDAEFKAASLRVYEDMAEFDEVSWAEPNS